MSALHRSASGASRASEGVRAPFTHPLRVLLYAAIILPWLVAAGVAWQWRRDAIDSATTTAAKTAGIVREHMLRVIEGQVSAIDIVDRLIAGMSWDEIRQSEPLHRELRAMVARAPHIEAITLMDPDAHGANNSDVFPAPALDVADRDYFRALKARDELHIGRVIEGRRTGKFYYTVSRRRRTADGSFDGLILITVAQDYLENFWQSLVADNGSADNGSVVTLVRKDGNMLGRYPGLQSIPPSLAPNSPFFKMARQQQSGTYRHLSEIDGTPRIYAFDAIGDLGLFAIVGFSRDVVLATWRSATIYLGLAAALVSFLLSAFILLAQRNQNALAREIERRSEVEKTLVAREEHVAALERADVALRAGEKKFRTLFERLKQGVLIRDRDGVIIAANAAAERIFGNSVEEMRGQTTESLGWMPLAADGEKIPVDCRPSIAALRTGKESQGALMSVFNAAHAERRWIITDAIPITDTAGSIKGVFSIYSDVTEQRRAEETERLLAREVDHRAKNTLAVIQAIVRLSRAPTLKEFVASVEGRIHALASVHTLLARGRWSGADLRSVIDVELAPFRSTDGRITVSGPGVRLRAEAAQPVAMVIHELATNAAKYGALSPERPDAKLSIAWEYHRDGRLQLRWRETGVPIASPPKKTGFGDRLIRTTVESQFRGSWQPTWTADGLDAVMVLPPNTCTADRRVNAAESERPGGPAPRGLRVLLAEDNAIVAEEMSSLIEDIGGAPVGPAASREEVVAFGDPTKIDVAVLDVDLGGVSVIPAAETLVKRGIPIIFCTGYSELPGLSAQLREAPIVQKPVSVAELSRAIGAVLEREASVRGGSPTAPAPLVS
jgi:PAS domain S-box-containing protein